MCCILRVQIYYTMAIFVRRWIACNPAGQLTIQPKKSPSWFNSYGLMEHLWNEFTACYLIITCKLNSGNTDRIVEYRDTPYRLCSRSIQTRQRWTSAIELQCVCIREDYLKNNIICGQSFKIYSTHLFTCNKKIEFLK